jgi:hypothetical protein
MRLSSASLRQFRLLSGSAELRAYVGSIRGPWKTRDSNRRNTRAWLIETEANTTNEGAKIRTMRFGEQACLCL